MHWMILPFKRYFDFSGRSCRKEWWMFTLFYFLVMLDFVIVMFAGLPWNEITSNLDNPETVELAGRAQSEPGPLFWVGVIGIGLFGLLSFIPSISVTVRRFHDQDLSGWLYLLNFIPYVGWIVIWVFMCIQGTRAANKYGEDPLDPNNIDIFA